MMKRRNKIKSFTPLVNIISEAGLLKRTRRSGWSVLGIGNAESVADHSFRCAVIGYFLARIEGASEYKVLLMTLFNDLHEARITDLHKMAQRYFNIDRAEDNAFKEQIDSLPSNLGQGLSDLRKEYRLQRSRESIIARDADILECLIQAKEYGAIGYKKSAQFMKKAPGFLKTESAKRLWKRTKSIDPDKWWLDLSDFKR